MEDMLRHFLFRVVRKIYYVSQKLKNIIIELFNNDYLLITSFERPLFHNWGDDVSRVLVQLIAPERKIIPRAYSWNIRKRRDYLCIGSIIPWMITSESIIWGSGVQFPEDEIKYKPYKVLAVRGPLTREYLLTRNIDCPEIYGDPALLFPRYYTPHLPARKYKCGVIPHFRDKKSAIVKKLIEKYSVHLIDVQNIKKWNHFIDEIVSCEFILSSSLHGIIISDAYNVPNCWVEFDVTNLKRFTFRDYFLSVSKQVNDPVDISEIDNLQEVLELKQNWKSPMINLDKLMSVCPFV